MKQFRLALITGASSGIGRELAYFLADKGIALCLTGRNDQALEKVRKDLERKVSVSSIKCDLAKPQERTLLIDLIRLKAPDLVINNAGFGTYGRIVKLDTLSQMEMAEVMVKAVLELTIEAAKALVHIERKGTIVNISSSAAFLPMPLFANYAACKAYSKSLSLALDYELKSSGIRVLCSCPGVVNTGFRKTASAGEEKHPDSFLEMDVDYAVKRIWRQIEEGKTIDVFDWKYRFMLGIMKLVPAPILNKMIVRSMEKITPRHKM